MEFTPKEAPKNKLGMDSEGGGGFLRIAVATVVMVVVVAGAGLIFLNRGGIFNSSLNFEEKYQAIFLTNGQVYFGEVTSNTDSDIVLQKVYYLQLSETLQPQTEDFNDLPEITLVKLGNELHGPTDKMIINRDHILYIEDLQGTSRVVQAINNQQ